MYFKILKQNTIDLHKLYRAAQKERTATYFHTQHTILDFHVAASSAHVPHDLYLIILSLQPVDTGSLVEISQKVKVVYIRSFFCTYLLATNSESLQ